jgi:hypothetical protein
MRQQQEERAMREIQPISGASVWHGRKMASSSRWRRRLSDAQLAEIDRAGLCHV